MSFRMKDKYLSSLIERGFFPKEVPFCFRPINFTKISQTSPVELEHNKNQSAQLISHNITRFGTFTRKLGIPNPITHYRLSKVLSENLTQITPLPNEIKYGVTLPEFNDTGRAFKWKSDWQQWKEEKIKRQAGYKYLLKTDISNFYPSIYTHIIPWVIHGKSVSKKKPRDFSLIGNIIDANTRFSQDNQTQGIPIGPDTSFILSELILNHIDNEINEELKKVKIKHNGIRFVDDYEFYFQNSDDANKALNIISRTFSSYELSLSPHKTEVFTLPLEFEKKWVSQIRSYPKPISKNLSVTGKRQLIIDYFDFVIELQKEHPHEQIISYALARIEKDFYILDDEYLFFSLLINIIPLDTSVLKWIIHFLNLKIELIESQKLKSLFQEVIPKITIDCGEHGKHNDTLWSLLIAYIFDVGFTEKESASVYDLGNAFVKIICLDLSLVELMKIKKSLNPKESDFYGEDWLLYYTVFTNNEFEEFRTDKPCKYKKNQFFKMLKKEDVSFYESFPSDSSIESIKEYVSNICKQIERSEYKIEIDGEFYDPEDPNLINCSRCSDFFYSDQEGLICDNCWEAVTTDKF